MRNLLLGVVIAIGMCLWARVGLAQAGRPAAAGSVVHVVVSGDLECMQAARELRLVITDAHRDRCALVVVEFSGDESRLDVVSDMAKTIRESQVPVVVFLQDKDGVVGAGALALGMIAGECVIGPRVVVGGRCAGVAQAELAPDKAPLTAMTAELEDWMRRSAATRGWTEGMEMTLVSPSNPWWVVFDKGGYTVVSERPADAEALPLVVEKDGVHRVSLDARTAVKLRLAASTFETWIPIASRRELKGAARVERTINAALGPRAAKAESLLAISDAAYEQAQKTLKLTWPAARDIAPSKYRSAAAEGQRSLNAAGSALVQLERLLEEYPEVMRRPAPGQTQVGGRASTYTTKWRSMVQSRRDKITKLAETAEKFSGV